MVESVRWRSVVCASAWCCLLQTSPQNHSNLFKDSSVSYVLPIVTVQGILHSSTKYWIHTNLENKKTIFNVQCSHTIAHIHISLSFLYEGAHGERTKWSKKKIAENYSKVNTSFIHQTLIWLSVITANVMQQRIKPKTTFKRQETFSLWIHFYFLLRFRSFSQFFDFVYFIFLLQFSPLLEYFVVRCTEHL